MQLSLPFHHSSIKFILKDQIMSSPIFKGRNYGLFPATHPDRPDAREVADPMVAISATAVRFYSRDPISDFPEQS